MKTPRSTFPFQSERGEALDAEGGASAPLAYLKLDIDANHNQRVVFQEIRTQKRVTRTELANITGLTKPTIVNVSRHLLQAGLIVEAERASLGRGQPAWVLELNPDGAYSAGLNIDRDHMTLVALDLGGQIRGRVSTETSFASPEEAQRFFAGAWQKLATKSNIPLNRVVGLGVALPDELGTLAFPGKPPGYTAWADADIAELFRSTYTGPTFVENDAVAAAIGEAQFGHGLEAPSFVYILISVLLGGGIVINRTYFRGENGRSGEIGFMQVEATSGGTCALQDVVSLGALSERLKRHGVSIGRPSDLSRLDAGGDAVVEEWIKEACGYLTSIFAQIGQFIDPDSIMLGGRLPDRLLDRLATLCRQRQKGDQPTQSIDIRRAKLSSDAPAIGAAILPFQTLLFPSLQMLGRF
ncbi:ROK family transcriptional regulator [Sphingomonas koreensis]|nr:ROK family transcriptional regulator [Sphingomonas koreensis]